jgi:hypothetical protein
LLLFLQDFFHSCTSNFLDQQLRLRLLRLPQSPRRLQTLLLLLLLPWHTCGVMQRILLRPRNFCPGILAQNGQSHRNSRSSFHWLGSGSHWNINKRVHLDTLGWVLVTLAVAVPIILLLLQIELGNDVLELGRSVVSAVLLVGHCLNNLFRPA